MTILCVCVCLRLFKFLFFSFSLLFLINRLALPSVCLISGRLSGPLAVTRAMLARLCAFQTAGMCSLPPGGGSERMGKRGVSGDSEWEACCSIVGNGQAY